MRKQQYPRDPAPSVPLWQPVVFWLTASSLGAAAGAWLAVLWFPRAGFARTPTGHPDDANVFFAVILGLAIAVPQWAVLRYLADRLKTSRKDLLLAWIPAVGVGITAMLLPIYYVDASKVGDPAVLVPRMLPGVLLLGLGEWFILSLVFSMRPQWILWTCLGTLLGAVVGAFFASMSRMSGFTSGPEPGVVEATWAFMTGLSMGLAQAWLLPTAGRRPSEWSRLD